MPGNPAALWVSVQERRGTACGSWVTHPAGPHASVDLLVPSTDWDVSHRTVATAPVTGSKSGHPDNARHGAKKKKDFLLST